MSETVGAVAPGATRGVLSRPVAFTAAAITFAALYLAAGAPTPLLVVFERRWGFPDWVLTIAFAVYAVALLSSLLVVGSLSDYIGRRTVLVGALAVALLAMLMFVFAPNIGWVIAARAVQGAATGAATTAFSAALLDLAPERQKKLAGIINGTAAAGGLGLGALFTGLAVQVSDHADQIVFTVLAIIMAAGTAAAALSPEAGQRQSGALRSLLPNARVPRAARAEFISTLPVQVGAWMLAGLFMGLMPTILETVLHRGGGLLDGFTAFLEPGAAAAAGFVLGRLSSRRTVLLGGAAVAAGAVVIVVGILAAALPVIWLGGIVGGAGFGASFSGALRVIVPLSHTTERAGLFAAIHVGAYLSFGVAVIIAGLFIAPFGLLPVVLTYAGAIVVLAAAGLIAQGVRVRAAADQPAAVA
jgi:hypothetical protein